MLVDWFSALIFRRSASSCSPGATYSPTNSADTITVDTDIPMIEGGFGCHVAGVPQGVDELAESLFDSDLLLAMNSSHRFASVAAIGSTAAPPLPPAAVKQVVLRIRGASR